MFSEKILSAPWSVRHVLSCRVPSHHKNITKTDNYTPLRFFQVVNQKEYQKMVIISFVHLKKINTFCFTYKGVEQKLNPPRPLEN